MTVVISSAIEMAWYQFRWPEKCQPRLQKSACASFNLTAALPACFGMPNGIPDRTRALVTDTAEPSAEKAYRLLEGAILSGRFKPRERLIERDLVAELKLSRTPIREALTRLREAGVVRSAPRRGLTVSHFTGKEIVDLYYVREALERAAAKLIVAKVTPAALKLGSEINRRFVVACDKSDLNAMIRTNDEFHRVLLEIAENAILEDALKQIRLKAFLCRYSLWSEPGAARKSANSASANARCAAATELEGIRTNSDCAYEYCERRVLVA